MMRRRSGLSTLQESRLFLAIESQVLHTFPSVDLSSRLRINGLIPLIMLIASLAGFWRCSLIVLLQKISLPCFIFSLHGINRFYHAIAQWNLHVPQSLFSFSKDFAVFVIHSGSLKKDSHVVVCA